MASASSQRRCGSCGKIVLVATTLPVASTTATFTPVRKPGSSPSVGRAPAGAASRRSRKLAANTRDSFFLGPVPQAQPEIDRQRDEDLRAPRPAHGIGEPLVAWPSLIGNAVGAHDAQLVEADRRARRGIVRLDRQAEDFFPLATEKRQHAMRRHLAEGFREIEVVAELGACLLLAFAHLGLEARVGPELLAQGADQVGILGKTFGENGARTVQRRLQRRRRSSRAETKGSALVWGTFCGSCSSRFASGSRPASLAISALVRRLGL